MPGKASMLLRYRSMASRAGTHAAPGMAGRQHVHCRPLCQLGRATQGSVSCRMRVECRYWCMRAEPGTATISMHEALLACTFLLITSSSSMTGPPLRLRPLLPRPRACYGRSLRDQQPRPRAYRTTGDDAGTVRATSARLGAGRACMVLDTEGLAGLQHACAAAPTTSASPGCPAGAAPAPCGAAAGGSDARALHAAAGVPPGPAGSGEGAGGTYGGARSSRPPPSSIGSKGGSTSMPPASNRSGCPLRARVHARRLQPAW